MKLRIKLVGDEESPIIVEKAFLIIFLTRMRHFGTRTEAYAPYQFSFTRHERYLEHPQTKFTIQLLVRRALRRLLAKKTRL